MRNLRASFSYSRSSKPRKSAIRELAGASNRDDVLQVLRSWASDFGNFGEAAGPTSSLSWKQKVKLGPPRSLQLAVRTDR